jgi:hypothetical protein
MAHIANTMIVQTEVTVATLAPIITQRIPDVIPTLPPGYHVLNALLNSNNPAPPQTPAGSPGGPLFPGHPIPGFIPKSFLLVILTLVVLSQLLHQTHRFMLVDRVARFLFLFLDTTQLLRNPRLEHNFRVELYL